VHMPTLAILSIIFPKYPFCIILTERKLFMPKQLITLLSILMFSIISFNPVFAQADNKPLEGKKLVVLLKSGDSSEAGMGLALAHSAVKKGAQVTIVLGANAALYPVKKGAQRIFAAKNKIPRDMLKEIIADGGIVYLCALCAKWQGLQQSDLIDGVEIVKSMKIWNKLYEEEAKSLTF
jgi:predicted peroxiredoxin